MLFRFKEKNALKFICRFSEKGGAADMMRKKCFKCNEYTYTEEDQGDIDVFCVYCGEDLTAEQLLPLGNFKGPIKFPTRPIMSKP